MPLRVNGRTYYATAEACGLAGTNVHTFFRWVRQGKFRDVEYRDRNGWRLFTIGDIRRLNTKVTTISRSGNGSQVTRVSNASTHSTNGSTFGGRARPKASIAAGISKWRR